MVFVHGSSIQCGSACGLYGIYVCISVLIELFMYDVSAWLFSLGVYGFIFIWFEHGSLCIVYGFGYWSKLVVCMWFWIEILCCFGNLLSSWFLPDGFSIVGFQHYCLYDFWDEVLEWGFLYGFCNDLCM